MLAAGTKLGPYEIVSSLGAGGMGEVYRARDTRLKRDVAIKVLPPLFSTDEERLARFEREARAIAQLEHPHICALYDVGRDNDIDFLVMPYLEGDTLADRIQKGPLPLDQALKTAIEICDALDKAHRQGIVHRDLKPGNVMLTKSGAKLLDFGLAKPSAHLRGGVHSDAATAPATVSSPMTEEGTILGTFQYMAPEQLEGREADARSDIWAIGCVLYEMLTARRAFTGKSRASLIAAILEREPVSIATLKPSTPPACDHVVRRCLAKNPDERWQSAADIAVELKWVAETRSAPDATQRGGARWRDRAIPFAAGIAAAAIVALMIAGTGRAVREESRDSVRSEVSVSPADSLLITVSPALAISPSGRHIVYRGRSRDRQDRPGILYLRALNGFDAHPLPGTEGGSGPFFSPDGSWLAFFAFGKLHKLALSGGAPIPLAEGSNNRGGSWGADGTIVFAPATQGGVFRVPSSGGDVRPVSTLDRARHEKSHRFPHILPGGTSVLVTTSTGNISTWDQARIEIIEIETGKRRVVVEGGSNAVYVPTGHLLYAQGGALLAVPFDVARLDVTGPPVKVVDDVLVVPSSGRAEYAVSENGTLVYAATGGNPPGNTLHWVDRQGRTTPFGLSRQAYIDPVLSPTGDRLAVNVEAANDQIWVHDFERGGFTRITSGWDNTMPGWTPDGKRILFGSNRDRPFSLYWQLVDGSGPPEPLVQGEHAASYGRMTRDGRTMVYIVNHPETGPDLWMVDIAGDRRPQPLVVAPGAQVSPALSPDGRWLAYSSPESGRAEIYVRPFPKGDGRWQVSIDGGIDVRWSARGNEIFYRFGNRVYAARVTSTPHFRAERPQVLFESAFSFRGFDVAPDAQRFVMIASDDTMAPTRLRLVVNFFDELKRKVPSH